MAYLSLYRKWRPQSFDDVVGQEHVVRTLKNALDSRRTAHAYLFAGPRGTGKTTLARLLAKGLNCENGPTGSPCNRCASCTRISRGTAVDVIEIDGASNRGIDEIRDVREMVKFAPAEGEYKVYIIDEVHMLTTEAFNALLKVLEEPPEHVVFVFATTEPHKIPATIVSRCQKFDFHSFSADEIAAQLARVAEQEGVSIDPEALSLIARHSDGGMRDALGSLDQCIAFASGKIDVGVVAQVLGVVEVERLHELADALASDDLAACLTLVKKVADEGRDLRQFAVDAVRYFRDLLVLAVAPDSRELAAITGEGRQQALSMAARFSLERLLEIVEALGRAESDMRWATAAQLPLEMTLIRLVKEKDPVDVQALARRVEALEKRLQGWAPQRAAHPALPGEPLSHESALHRPVSHRTPPFEAATPSEPEKETLPIGTGERPARSAGGDQPNQPGDVAMSFAPAPPAAGEEVPDLIPGQGHETGEQAYIETVQRAWPRVLEALRAAKHVQQEAFLREGSPVQVEGDTVIVAFSPNHRFHQANMEKDKNRVIVEKVMSKVLGRNLRLRAVLGMASALKPAPADEGPFATGESPPEEPGFTVTSESRSPAGERPASVPGQEASNNSTEPHSTVTLGQERREAPGPVRVAQRQANPEFVGTTVDPDEIDEPILKAALKLFGGTITRIERKEAETS